MRLGLEQGVETEVLRYRVPFVLLVVLLLFLLVLFPFSVSSALVDLQSTDGPLFPIQSVVVPEGPLAPNRAYLHIGVEDLDERHRQLTLRVAGHYVCPAPCGVSHQVVFFAITDVDVEAESLPPSVTVPLPPSAGTVSQVIDLPIVGHPVRYPFDTYTLVLGVVPQRVLPDGTMMALTPAEADGRLFLTLQERVPRFTMDPPEAIYPADVRNEVDPFGYVYVQELTFQRPLYIQAVTVLLVMLITAAAAYAVFLRPFSDLIINAGGLVLGVWGIRSILTPPSQTWVSAVDLSLSVVLLFLLGAITVRVLMYLHEQSSGRQASHGGAVLGANEGVPGASKPRGQRYARRRRNGTAGDHSIGRPGRRARPAGAQPPP